MSRARAVNAICARNDVSKASSGGLGSAPGAPEHIVTSLVGTHMSVFMVIICDMKYGGHIIHGLYLFCEYQGAEMHFGHVFRIPLQPEVAENVSTTETTTQGESKEELAPRSSAVGRGTPLPSASVRVRFVWLFMFHYPMSHGAWMVVG